jgi:hypothetical protein
MNGEISFGADFIAILVRLGELTSVPAERFTEITVPIMKALLVEWGLSLDETEQAMKLWVERWKAKQIDLKQIVQRVVHHLKDNEEAKQRLITHMATMAYLDLEYNDSERDYVRSVGRELDMRPSEIQEYAVKGASFAHYLDQFGKGYIEYVK